MNKLLHLTITAIVIFAATNPAAATESMSLKQVIETVLKHHPDLHISRLDAAIAATNSQRIEGMLDPELSANLSASEEKVATFSSFQAAETRIGQISAGIAKPLSNGGTLGVNFNYSRTSQAFNSPLAAQLANFNPAFRNQINISYRHPLFKGNQRPDYHQSLISTQASIAQAEQQQQVIAQNLSLQALNTYYQLSADDINIHIAQQAVKRTKKLLSYQRSRERFGLIEKADRLQAEALLAARRTDLQRARGQRLNDQSSLNRLMLRPAATAIVIPSHTRQTSSSSNTANMAEAMTQAEKMRPELRVLKAQMQAANAALLIARDANQMQLDVVAEAGTRALASHPATAAARGLNVKNHYASVSLELSDLLGRNTAHAGIRQAELQRQRIQAQRLSQIEKIRDEIAAAMTAINSGTPTLVNAKNQVVAEQRKFNAEMQRYKQGRSDTATLVQFEGELRNAALNAELQQLTLQLATQQLLWAQGSLLHDLGLTGSEPIGSDTDNKPASKSS